MTLLSLALVYYSIKSLLCQAAKKIPGITARQYRETLLFSFQLLNSHQFTKKLRVFEFH